MVKKRLPIIEKALMIPVVLFLLLLGGCTEPSGASAGKIIAPPVQESPLAGKWTVIRELSANGDGEESTQQWMGSDVQFSANAVALGGYVWDRISYKIKRVNAVDYLMTKYTPSSGISVTETGEADVITVYAAANFLGEAMRLDEESMIFFVQNKELLLEKVSDQADDVLGSVTTSTQDLSRKNEETSGVLLGLRIPGDKGDTYRTLWIASDPRQFRPVLFAEQLFFPRTSGFWELKVENSPENGAEGNLLTARNLSAKVLEPDETEAGTEAQAGPENKPGTGAGDTPGADPQDALDAGPAVRTIHYIGNDYAAIEEERDGVRQLQLLPVDNLASPAKIKISDLLGDEGLRVYSHAREEAAAALKDQGVTSIDRDESGENFGLVRKNGHWFFVGRINYQEAGTHRQTDFDLKIVPPANLIFYDTLVLNWYKIKDRVPDALDAFTSPNKDIVLVKTKNKLTVFPIGREQLEESPLTEIDLPEGTAVIMAEWGTGSYVDSWEKSFLSYGAQVLKDDDAVRGGDR